MAVFVFITVFLVFVFEFVCMTTIFLPHTRGGLMRRVMVLIDMYLLYTYICLPHIFVLILLWLVCVLLFECFVCVCLSYVAKVTPRVPSRMVVTDTPWWLKPARWERPSLRLLHTRRWRWTNNGRTHKQNTKSRLTRTLTWMLWMTCRCECMQWMIVWEKENEMKCPFCTLNALRRFKVGEVCDAKWLSWYQVCIFVI